MPARSLQKSRIEPWGKNAQHAVLFQLWCFVVPGGLPSGSGANAKLVDFPNKDHESGAVHTD
jgi:hypothetical protein